MADPYAAYRQNIVPFGTGSTGRMAWLANAPQFQGSGPLAPGAVQRETMSKAARPPVQRQPQNVPFRGGAAGGTPGVGRPGGSLGAPTTLNTGQNVHQQNASSSPYGSGLNLDTSIVPRDIYSPQMTQHAVNQIRADAAQAANLPYLMKLSDRAGVSRGAGALGLAAPRAAAALAGGQEAAGNLILDDATANRRQRLAGEIARSGEARGLGGLWASIMDQEDQFRRNQLGRAFRLFDMIGGA